jgi:hypothetical protein
MKPDPAPEGELGQPIAAVPLTSGVFAVRPELGSSRLWLVQEATADEWLSEFDGLAGVYITSPASFPRQLVVGGTARRPDGAPSHVTHVRLTLEPSGRGFGTVVKGDAWLIAVPPDGSAEAGRLSFHASSGDLWETVDLGPLTGMLGDQLDSSPGGDGWTPYASLL